MTQLTADLNRSIDIGGRQVGSRLLMAPMAGLTHVAFRHLAAEYGGYGLMFTEMCSAKALPQENPRVSPVFQWRASELPHLVCQIFGSDPDTMARAAQRIESEGFFGVDVNMGCCVAAICKQGAGAALLRQPDRAADVVAALRSAVDIPVTVKFRTGWQDDPAPAVDMARRLADAGAYALIFHPRVAPDLRARPPKWDYIRAVKEAVDIPVFGNGEVFTEKDCQAMLDKTGCHGVALGRMALARPWIFAQWTGGFVPDEETYPKCAHRMLDLLAHYYEPVNAMRRFRKWIVYFAANFVYGHQFSSKVRRAKDMDAARREIDAFFASDPARGSVPNRNLFQ